MSSILSQNGRLFKFKQFSLTDEGCGMKIGTDGVILGGIAAGYKSQKTLDVGTGCGLIALMVAQKSAAQITALEIDRQAAETARLNILNSPWASRIVVLNQSFQDFYEVTHQNFDLIVCNPPFFHNSYLAPKKERNLARHSDALRPDELLQGAANILSKLGFLLVIIPFEQVGYWQKTASQIGLFCGSVTHIFPNQKSGPKRSVLEFSAKSFETRTSNLVLEAHKRHSYTQDYIDLTKDYYLYM